jgi:hypothetical protein
MMIMKNLLLASLAISLAACASNGSSFESMSELELAAYNRELPIEQHVYCLEEATSSTYIRKRVCRTYEDWLAHNERELMRLDVLNSRPSTGLQSTVRDGI